MYQYSLGKKKTSVSNSARVIQFPLKLCFATTSHKFQGQTVVKPNKIAVDLRSVFRPAMAYVMLSRVQELGQLSIIGSLPVSKIYADPNALEELNRLNKISMNKNPSKWESNKSHGLNILSLNCQSLRSKIRHIRDDPVLKMSDVICLSETWLTPADGCVDLHIDGYKLWSNSVGHGKGLATYFKADKFHHQADVKDVLFQLTKVSSETMDIISIYKSAGGDVRTFHNHLLKLIDETKITIICGDFNICFKSDRNNYLIKLLEEYGFTQLVHKATHLKGGLIDHAYIRNRSATMKIDVSLYSPYYCAKDHDAVQIALSFK